MATIFSRKDRVREEPRTFSIKAGNGGSSRPMEEGRAREVSPPLVEQCPDPSWTKRKNGRITTFSNGKVTFNMVAVQGGEFMMGMDVDHSGNNFGISPELKAHRVILSDFSIGDTPVTQALWLEVMGNNPSQYKENSYYDGNLQRPVENISVQECYRFMERLGSLTGEKFTLPTEAQWEYAARGGRYDHGYTFSGGNDPLAVGWFIENSQDHQGRCIPQSVGMKAPNELGLYDMTGNVAEWCRDMYDSTYYRMSKMHDPCATYNSYYLEVIRGGCFESRRKEVELRSRSYYNAFSQTYIVGLRLGIDSPAE